MSSESVKAIKRNTFCFVGRIKKKKRLTKNKWVIEGKGIKETSCYQYGLNERFNYRITIQKLNQ